MVDAGASKALGRKVVWVRVPLRARCYLYRVSNTDPLTLAMFPGQGALEAQAGRAWSSDPAWSIVAQVSEISHIDVEHLLLEAEEDEIVRTDNAQIATFALSLVSYAAYVRTFEPPRHFVGHSLGEFSALVAAGVLSLEDGVRIVSARGQAMADAATLVPGTMAALMGGGGKDISPILERDGIWLGNVNGSDQIVISGRTDALVALEADITSYGWKRCRILRVGGAFHSPLMAPAAPALREALHSATFHETTNTIYANVDGVARHGGLEWQELAERQLTEPVQFVRCIESAARVVTEAIELQPAGVLKGLVKRIAPEIEVTVVSRENLRVETYLSLGPAVASDSPLPNTFSRTAIAW